MIGDLELAALRVEYCSLLSRLFIGEVDADLMRAVEQTAQELAADIKTGKRDMRKLDLEEIGVKAITRLQGDADDPKLLAKVNVLLELLTDNPVFANVVDSVMSTAGV